MEGRDIGLFIRLIPQSLMITFSYSLAQKLSLSFNGWLIKLSIQTFQPLILIYSVGMYIHLSAIVLSLDFPDETWLISNLNPSFHS